MRTLISLNGWWGFFFRRNSRILAFTAILLVVFVTDLGGASDWSNGQLGIYQPAARQPIPSPKIL
jgi:hypothetical protein